MSSQNDASDFVDADFQSSRKTAYTAHTNDQKGASSPASLPNRPPSREEIEAMVSEKQLKLAELKRVQDELERERAGLEELRRRQIEFQTGRQEMLQHLTRGMGLLEEAELNTRRDAEAMTRTLTEFRDAISKVQAINENLWKQENLTVELTRALTVIENARMEWNTARLKFPILSGEIPAEEESKDDAQESLGLSQATLGQWCKIGLALTWPLVLLGIVTVVMLAIILSRR